MLVANSNHMHCYLMLINEKSVTMLIRAIWCFEEDEYDVALSEDKEPLRPHSSLHAIADKERSRWGEKKWNLILLCQDHLNQFQFLSWNFNACPMQWRVKFAFLFACEAAAAAVRVCVVGRCLWCGFLFCSRLLFVLLCIKCVYFDEPIKSDLFATSEPTLCTSVRFDLFIHSLDVFFHLPQTRRFKCDDRIIWDKGKKSTEFLLAFDWIIESEYRIRNEKKVLDIVSRMKWKNKNKNTPSHIRSIIISGWLCVHNKNRVSVYFDEFVTLIPGKIAWDLKIDDPKADLNWKMTRERSHIEAESFDMFDSSTWNRHTQR